MGLLKKTIDEDIRDARKKLRDVYSKYQEELHTIVMKIDNMLETLEQKEETYEE